MSRFRDVLQEPLYLPSNSELQVSIWRLTNERRVWYEWHAESFLTIPVAASDNSMASTAAERLLSSFFAPSSGGSLPSANAPSPLIDAAEPLPSFESRASIPRAREPSSMIEEEMGYDIVKIGHTSLHNPAGRSSWIGL